MGIVNVTPDSFSDGGRFLDAGAARRARPAGWRRRAPRSSTSAASRPGPGPRRWRRGGAAPGAAGARGRSAAAGVGARDLDRHAKAAVAARRDRGGARASSTTSRALRGDPEMAGVVAAGGVELLPDAHARRAAHDAERTRATATSWTRSRRSSSERLAFAVGGRDRASERIMLDPGIGFGKTVAHNLALLARLDELAALGRPIVIGTSRKSFLGGPRRPRRGVAQPLEADRSAGRARSPPTCSRSSAERASSASTRSAPCGDALAVAAATLGARWTARSTPRTPTTWTTRMRRARRGARGRRRVGHGRDQRACRCTPTTVSPTPSARSASAW